MSHCALSDRPESFVVNSNGMSTTSFDVTKKVQIWEEKNSQRLLYTAVRLNIRMVIHIHCVKERTNLHDGGKFEALSSLNYREQHFQKDLPLVIFTKTSQT